MEWIVIEGKRMHFFNPIKGPSFQSIMGQAPNYGPSAMFYGLLLSVIANHYQPYIIRPTMTAGTSSAIKVYYLDYWSYTGVLILNKDTNASRNGVVKVTMKDKTGLHCMYVKASSLSATSGISIAGYDFISGTSTPQGLFAQYQIAVDSAGVYNVPVNYSQMVFCRVVDSSTNYRQFPRWNQLSDAWKNICILGLLLLMLFF